jgi:hypothetical protein
LPDLRAWRGLAPAASLEEVKAAVEGGSLLIQFILDERDLLVLTAERSTDGVTFGAHVVAVRRQAVAEHVARAVDPSSVSDAEAWRRAARELVTLLPAPVLAQLTAARRVVVVPDDMLWRVPFEALPVGTGFLGEQASVTYAASVTSIVRAPAASVAATPLKVIVAAAPEIPSIVADMLKTTAPSWTLRPPEAAEKEAARVRSSLGDEATALLTGPAATEEAVRSGATDASVLHVGAPFRVNAASPMFSSILLSRSGTATDVPSGRNGVLEAREIPTADLATRLAVFSDPASLSMREAAAALPALQWVLRAGGMETLIVRRWGSDEAAAGEILATFYEQVRAGKTPAEALDLARSAARKAGAPPQVWAGWLVIGVK